MFEDWEAQLEREIYGKAVAVEAITAIRQGRYSDAVTALEREFLPQWEDVADCEAAYREAVGR